MAFYGAFPVPTEEVDTFFSTLRLTTNLVDGSKPFEEDEGGRDDDRQSQAMHQQR